MPILDHLLMPAVADIFVSISTSDEDFDLFLDRLTGLILLSPWAICEFFHLVHTRTNASTSDEVSVKVARLFDAIRSGHDSLGIKDFTSYIMRLHEKQKL